MKTIGLLGGMSWESSLEYYRIINEMVRARVGNLHSARCILYSFDFAKIETFQRCGEWQRAAELMADAAKRLEKAGAELLVICTNTMHKVADEVERCIGIPLLHIADATATRVHAAGLHTVGLLGTRFTMEEEFYRGRLVRQHGLQVLIPPEEERALVHRVIFEELCAGRFSRSSRSRYREIIERLADAGAQGVILGCTEIGLLVHAEDSSVPLFDTTRIHAEAAVDWALA